MKKQNIVVLLCDQLRSDFLPAYGGGAIPTPNIDRLAERGVVFDRAITASTVCAPARASMMTGRYVSDHQVWTNDIPFRDGLEYLPERMNALGYQTGAFGKLHHFPVLDAKGFHLFSPMEEGRLGDQEPYLQWLREKYPEASFSMNTSEELTFAFSEEDYYEQWIASQAIRFIEECSDLPFFAWVSFQGPHSPFDPPPEVKGTCDESRIPAPLERNPVKISMIPPHVRMREVLATIPRDKDKLKQWRVAYAEMIVAIDRQIGRILNKLDDLGLYENTTFIFSADHGDMLGDYHLEYKGPFPYRAQLNIPLILSNHPQLNAGTRSKHLTGNIDIATTCLDIAGDTKPLAYSRSLIDLASPEPFFTRTVNFSEFCDTVKIVETARFRFCYYPFTGVTELYDLIEDPNETTNLTADPAYCTIKTDLLQHMLDFQILAKGVRVEAHDFVTEQQTGLAEKNPMYQDDYLVCFPLNSQEKSRIESAGLDGSFNEFCKNKPVLRSYTDPYWRTDPSTASTCHASGS